jgi:hypothetical protein
MKNLQIPGSLQPGDTTAFGGAYPVNDHGTGLNNIEWNNYPAATNDRIVPVAHPLDPSRPVCVSYTVKAGDNQPHYGASGERAVLIPEPHDGVEGVGDAVCSSFVIPTDHRSPTRIPGVKSGWLIVLQLHPGEPPYPDNNWNWPIVDLVNDEIAVQFGDRDDETSRKVFGPLTRNREFFVAFETLLKFSGGGYYRCWLSWDTPPDTAQTPFLARTGGTLLGSPMYWETGPYRNAEPFTSHVIQTTFARRPTMAQARAAAGWTGATPPPPPPPPPPPTDSLPIREVPGSRTATKVTLTWDPIPCLGYVLYANGARKSNTWDPTKSTWRTDIANEIKIIAYGEKASGTWRP